MFEHDQVWTIVGPDGTTAVFNDGLSGLHLEEVTGWDSPAIRVNLEDLPEEDGAAAGDFFYGARPWTMRGRVIAPTAAARNVTISNLRRTLRALRSDLTAKTQPSGLPAMQAAARIESLRLAGGYAKEFLIGLVSPDPRAYSQALHTEDAQGAAAAAGAPFPWVFPITFGGSSGSTLSLTATNAGDIEVAPLLRIVGPAKNPQLRNGSTDQWLYVDGLELAAGQWLEVDMAARTAVRDDGTSAYHLVRFPSSSWWTLRPGSNSVELWATGTDGTTVLEAIWRDAWA